MQIKDVLLAPGNGPFFYDDQKPIRSGAIQDGFVYVGAPTTPRFQVDSRSSISLSVPPTAAAPVPDPTRVRLEEPVEGEVKLFPLEHLKRTAARTPSIIPSTGKEENKDYGRTFARERLSSDPARRWL
uniref:hypothetical protein n=1 Tax=Mesorhizobium sp. L-2-11 TaxID=2744521 RepID=UPI00237BD2C2|nr:hypothetical protein [Mesorhizobium sp. L-2-11]